MRKIDSSFKILAVNLQDNTVCDETNSLLLCAKGKAVVLVMESYLAESINLGASSRHIESVKCLIDRIKAYQAGTYHGKIDRKFRLLAINPTTGEHYDESSAFILCATDKAAPAAIRTFIEECRRFGVTEQQLQRTNGLLTQVLDFQEENGSHLPAPEEAEAERCIAA